MNSFAPRCSEAWLPTFVCAGWSAAPPDAWAGTATNATSASRTLRRVMGSVSVGHAVRHGLERADARPEGHRDEEREIEEREDAREQRLAVGRRHRAEPAEQD